MTRPDSVAPMQAPKPDSERQAGRLARLQAQVMPARRLTDRLPVLMCGFRPFFVLTGMSAPVLMGLWLVSLGGLTLLPEVPGGIMLWHAHELIYGFGAASVAGFALTAIPEFTGTRPISRRPLARLVLLWLLARACYVLAGWWWPEVGLWPAAACNLALWVGLLAHIVPPLWRDPERRHTSFAWSMGAMALLEAGFFVALMSEGGWVPEAAAQDGAASIVAAAGRLLWGASPLAWLYAAVGVMMVLIIVAASRVSMSVLNRRVEAGRQGNTGQDTQATVYLARPPRRYLAVFTIMLCSAVEFVAGADIITGWTALAAAAATLNLLNDWHIGRRLFTRWALMLYGAYWLIALGYAAMGAAWLGAPLTASAGRHMLMAGAMALSIFAIMNIAGRIHAGQWLDRRRWVPVAACAIVLAALLRSVAGLWLAAGWTMPLLMGAGVLWSAAFVAYVCYAGPVLMGERSDGQRGCAEPLSETGPRRGGC